MVQQRARERGAALLLVTFVSAFLLIPIIGLCIDGAVVYWVKARLSSAVDATALATARSLNVGQDVSSQMCNAVTLGGEYFTANFPTSVMGTTVVGGPNLGQPCLNNSRISITEVGLHSRVVTVSASVSVPLYFMPFLGFKNQTVAATGQATRRDANIMLVLDRSGSMNLNGSCPALKASVQNFVNQFVDGRDQLGLVTYQFTANVDYKPRLKFKSDTPNLSDTIGSLVCGGDTNTVEGLYQGYDQIKNTINQPGALNAIVLFTDGQANAFVGIFEKKDQEDLRYGVSPPDQVVKTPASNCQAKTLTGVFGDAWTETASDVRGLAATGYTGAVVPNTPISLTQTVGWSVINAPGCAFYRQNDVVYARQDIKGIPTTDIHGNSTIDNNYLPLDYFPVGHPFHGYIRPDMPRDARWAAMNATDSLAQKIRQDSVYSPIVYTIGLQGNEPMAIDQDWMERLANDPNASNRDNTKPQGKFILAGDSGQLSAAFQQIASQILRLSK